MVMAPGLSVAESAGRDPTYPVYPATRVAHLVASIPAGIQVEMIIIILLIIILIIVRIIITI